MAGLSEKIVERLPHDLLAPASLPEVRARLTRVGVEVRPLPASETVKIVKSDLARWGALVKQLDLKTE